MRGDTAIIFNRAAKFFWPDKGAAAKKVKEPLIYIINVTNKKLYNFSSNNIVIIIRFGDLLAKEF